ncbi:MAG: SDR family NAD(P)-dependent oxidoreductase, partial [Acidimicrobiales bacterium]|nr:SDR family NAD(P)-dependent oxidoreductase [Acidimicrobiales bacterium]
MAQYDFSEKVAIVTGGASGIGKAVVEKLAEGGAKVVVADFDEVGGKATVDKINADGGTASFFKVDVANVEEVEAMVRFAVDTYGGLHIAVNNAGIGGASAPTGEYGIEDWNRVIDINLNGVFYGLRYQIPAMLESGGGSIVNIASILGSVGFASAPAYVAAKHGVVGLTKNAAIEYAT